MVIIMIKQVKKFLQQLLNAQPAGEKQATDQNGVVTVVINYRRTNMTERCTKCNEVYGFMQQIERVVKL